MSKILSLFLVAVFILGLFPYVSSAQTATSSVQTQLDLIVKLQQQIVALQEQLKTIQAQKQQVVSELIGTLRQGSQGSQVSALQALLAADPDIYPEGTISGFFGPATLKAVKRFQEKNNLETVGIVGPMTRLKLNALLKQTPIGFVSSSSTASTTEGKGRLCAIVPPGHLIAKGWLRTQAGGVAPIVPSCQTLPEGIAVKLGIVTPTSTATSTPSSTSDTTAPVISSVLSSVLSTSATVSWITNESSTSKVYYSTSTPVNLSSTITLSVTDNSLVTSHSLNLAGLAASSTYYYVVESADAAANVSTSTQQSFIIL